MFMLHRDNRTLGNALGRSHRIGDKTRKAMVAVLGEFCGTFMFLLLAFIGAQTAINNNAANSEPTLFPYSLMYIAASFGCALAVNVWVFYRVTGGMFNPAVKHHCPWFRQSNVTLICGQVTLGLVLVGAVKPLHALLIVPAQVAAGISAAAVTNWILPGSLGVANRLANGTNIAQGLFLEMFLTAQLVLTVYFLAVEKHRGTFLAPVGIGISVFSAHLAGTNYTGTGINPARSFGPAVIVGFTGYQWIYWLGPCMGAVLSFSVYKLLKTMEYESVNPGQDAEDEEKALQAVTALTSQSFATSDIQSDTNQRRDSIPIQKHRHGSTADEGSSRHIE
ncbi:aquaporin-like protein [Stachybotrys elegans]|uniref:Aquaporin-like protein n=1 Tax=Stachybotrys elegans TaxID=80388 RepID=A0A8K0SNI5_9HYPO|nr:aquaporin-like protein [Stachybotrys elegans]